MRNLIYQLILAKVFLGALFCLIIGFMKQSQSIIFIMGFILVIVGLEIYNFIKKNTNQQP